MDKGNGERLGVSDTSFTGFTELREEPPAPPVSPVPPVLQVPVVPSVPVVPAINIADYLPHHPFRGMSLDETAPTDEKIEGRRRYDRDKEAESRKRHHDKITEYNREYRRRRRPRALHRPRWGSDVWR